MPITLQPIFVPYRLFFAIEEAKKQAYATEQSRMQEDDLILVDKTMMSNTKGKNPIYGKVNGRIITIGYDDEDSADSFLVKGAAKRAVMKATRAGELYTGDLSNYKQVMLIPTGQILEDVQDTVTYTIESGATIKERVEFGAHTLFSKLFAFIWDPGTPMQIINEDDGSITLKWSVTPLKMDGKKRQFGGGVMSNNMAKKLGIKHFWHSQPTRSNPSAGDKTVLAQLRGFGFTINSFLIDTEGYKVSFFTEKKMLLKMKYDEFLRMGNRELIPRMKKDEKDNQATKNESRKNSYTLEQRKILRRLYLGINNLKTLDLSNFSEEERKYIEGAIKYADFLWTNTKFVDGLSDENLAAIGLYNEFLNVETKGQTEEDILISLFHELLHHVNYMEKIYEFRYKEEKKVYEENLDSYKILKEDNETMYDLFIAANPLKNPLTTEDPSWKDKYTYKDLDEWQQEEVKNYIKEQGWEDEYVGEAYKPSNYYRDELIIRDIIFKLDGLESEKAEILGELGKVEVLEKIELEKLKELELKISALKESGLEKELKNLESEKSEILKKIEELKTDKSRILNKLAFRMSETKKLLYEESSKDYNELKKAAVNYEKRNNYDEKGYKIE